MKRKESPSVPRYTQVYGVITADLVESRRLTNRALVQRRLLSLIHSLNSEFRRGLVGPFMVTLGDEIQGMLKDLSDLPNAVIRVHEVFHSREITVGVGIGNIATPVAKRVTEMDGPAFVNSRIAVELAKKEGLEVVVRSGIGRVDDTLNAVYGLLGGIQAGWTDAQWERFNLYRRLGTIDRVARKLKVSKQSISKSLRNTLWYRILDVEERLPSMFGELQSDAQWIRPGVGSGG